MIVAPSVDPELVDTVRGLGWFGLFGAVVMLSAFIRPRGRK